jgi:hypothetical protein
VALLALDFVITRKPHAVSMREATAWSLFYVALPLGFGAWVWVTYSSQQGVEYLTGYLVEKSLSVDNLFVLHAAAGAFAVPEALRQRVLLYGIVGGTAPARGVHRDRRCGVCKPLLHLPALRRGPSATAVKIVRDHLREPTSTSTSSRCARYACCVGSCPVTDEWHGPRLTVRLSGTRTPHTLRARHRAVFATDIVFAVDSVLRCTGSQTTRSWSSSQRLRAAGLYGPCTSC